MKHCCEDKSIELKSLAKKQGHILKIVLVINAAMFIIEFTMGWIAQSTSLLGDSLDMLGDAVLYGLTLFVLNRSLKAKAKVAFFKGLVLTTFGLGVLAEAIFKIFSDVIPTASTMGWIGGLALAANTFCLILLIKHKDDDLNMRSVYLCSRNDIVANIGVLIAALLVSTFSSKWPDIIVGGVIASLFLSSAATILKGSLKEIKGFGEF